MKETKQNTKYVCDQPVVVLLYAGSECPHCVLGPGCGEAALLGPRPQPRSLHLHYQLEDAVLQAAVAAAAQHLEDVTLRVQGVAELLQHLEAALLQAEAAAAGLPGSGPGPGRRRHDGQLLVTQHVSSGRAEVARLRGRHGEQEEGGHQLGWLHCHSQESAGGVLAGDCIVLACIVLACDCDCISLWLY